MMEFKKAQFLTRGLKLLLVTLFLFFGHLVSFSQAVSDLGDIEVEKLTDTQVKDLMFRAEELGISNDKLISIARQRGMSYGETTKLQRRIEQIKMIQAKKGESDITLNSRLRLSSKLGGEDVFESISGRDSLGYDLSIIERKIFGFSIFHNRNLDFSPNFNMPTPRNYTVGPGDELVINIFGAAQDAFKEVVSPDGKINLKSKGIIHVAGFTIEEVEKILWRDLSNFYSGLKGINPNTNISVTLGNIRSIKVNLVGELKSPGTYTLPSMSSVFNALYAAGGPTTQGTFRHIQVYRKSKLVSTVDVYQFLTKGEDTGGIRLEDNDVILVRPIENRVEIEGEVRVTGLFEMRENESLTDLLYYSGGFTEKAFKDNITVRRYTETEKRVEIVRKEDFNNFSIKDGDVFSVGVIQERFINRVQISGSVVRPGEYELTEGLKLTELIHSAGGLKGDAFLNMVTLYRTGPDLTLQANTLNLKGILNAETNDIELRNEDVINIPSVYDLREEYFVEIVGEVNDGGLYPFAEGMTVGDLILKAGGFQEAASGKYIEIARRVSNDIEGKVAQIITVELSKDLEWSSSVNDVELEAFDYVFVRKSPGYQEQRLVSIEGEVYYPGSYALDNVDMRISDLIKRAGGITRFGYTKGATLLRRTEAFEEADADEISIEKLGQLQESTSRTDLDNIEAERLLLERLDKKIEVIQETLLNKSLSEEAEDEQLTKRELREQANLDAGKEDLEEKELVGINLELILENPGSKYDLILQEGDIVDVPKELQTVRIRGRVLRPTTTRYDKSDGFKSYIGKAGGFSEDARRKRSYVVYANGDVKRTKHLLVWNFYPTIEPGAEINVPRNPYRRRTTISDVVGISTSLLTLYLLINSTGLIK